MFLRECLTARQLKVEIWEPEPNQGKKLVKWNCLPVYLVCLTASSSEDLNNY